MRAGFLLNCAACRVKEGGYVQTRGRCGKRFHLRGCKASKSECLCNQRRKLARCKTHCGKLLAVLDWVEHGKPHAFEITTCATDGSEVVTGNSECGTCSEPIHRCQCAGKKRKQEEGHAGGGEDMKNGASSARDEKQQVAVCPNCFMAAPRERDHQNRYTCQKCKQLQRKAEKLLSTHRMVLTTCLF